MKKSDDEIFIKMVKEKHKHDKFYRIGFWVFLVLFVAMTILYVATGDVITKTENYNKADVYIENVGDGNNNNVDIG